MNAWKTIKISRFLEERTGRFLPSDKALHKLPRLKKIDFSGNIHIANKTSKTGMIIIMPGDLVISGINVSKGAIAVYNGSKPITATIHYSSYKFDESQINIEYFKRFVKSEAFINVIQAQVRSGIKTEIKPKHFLALEIPLPDLKIQDELVDYFKSLETELSELEEEIAGQAIILDKLRQQILQDAVEGKLTADWRKQNPHLISGENHASKLLEKIKAEKARLIAEGKIKKDKPLPSIINSDIHLRLPDSWTYCRLGTIASIVRGGSPRPAGDKRFYDGTIPFLKVADLTANDDIYLNKYEYSIKDTGLCKTRYVEGNTLMLTNSGATLGIPKICLFPTAFNDGIAAFLGLHESMNKVFLYYFLKSKTKWFLTEAARGQGQPNLNTEIISQTILCLPSRAEQHIIVGKVKQLMSLLDFLEKQVSKRQEQSEMLMQSVLREAFNQEKN